MAERIENGFFKGMVKDLSDKMKEPSTYEDALDVRLNSNSSDSDNVIVNIKGNKFSFSVPDIPNILTITPDTIPTSWATNIIVGHTGGNSFGNSINGSTNSPDGLMDAIENELRTGNAFVPLQLNVARSGNTIRIWSVTTDILTFNTSATLTTTALQINQAAQIPIGWTRIDDDIYIISTNNDTAIGGIAAFYKVTYDKVSLVPNITLIYSDDLSMSTRFPVANPGGIESVKENDEFVRTYWTDGLDANDFRSMNLADPNIMAVPPLQLGIKPIVDLKKPVLKSIQNGGSITLGHYEVSYALRTAGGGITNYAHASNSIYINEDSLSSGYPEYQGGESGIITSKSFTITIPDVDTSFNSIDIVIIKTEGADASPLIAKVAELTITSSTVEYTYTGSEPAVIITEDAFNRRNNLFDKCHAIAQKDNILFAANTKRDPFNLNFDARAYRFDNTQEVILNDVSATPSAPYNSVLDLTGLDETSDAINPNQKIYKYQADGVTLGGEGPNIKYKFVNQKLLADARTDPGYVYPYRLPWRGNATVNLGDGTLYTEGNYFTDFKSPYIDHTYKGYRRGETYRFSLVPTKASNEGYAKWIGDIRMPDIFEDFQSGFAVDAAENEGKVFPLMSKANNVWYVNTLGVEFTVNIPANIADQIDSWVIKRVKLEPEDRTVLAQGIIHMCVRDNSHIPATYHPTLGENHYLNNISSLPDSTLNPSNSFSGNLESYPIVTFHSPDLLFGRDINKKTNDKIRIVQGLGTYQTTKDNALQPAIKTVYSKIYHNIPYEDPAGTSNTFDVKEIRNAAFDDDFLIDTYQFENRSPFITSPDGRRSRGTDTAAVVLDRGIPYDFYINMMGSTSNFYPRGGDVDFHADKYLVNYERENDGQYGGPGYSARSQNVYINTGAHVILNSNTLQHTVKVYGGDTYVNVFDTLKMTKSFDDFTGNNEPKGNGDKRIAVGLYYPCESFVNTDMRHGYSINGTQNPIGYMYGTDDQAPDAEQYPLDYGEDFKYNYVFSEQMDTQRSFPIPLNTTEVLRHPVRIWASAPKVYGELADAWRIFDSEKYIDIQGDLGEIRQLMKASDNIVAWQQRGFGVASVNERSVVNDNTGGGIVLGQSGVLPRFNYISESIGSWHQFSFIKSPNGIMFWDSKDAGLYVYNSEGLKDISADKIKGWLYSNTRGNILKVDSPAQSGNITPMGVCGTYDIRNKEYLITFYDNDSNINNNGLFDMVGRSFTIAYNDTKDRFVSYRSFKPTTYINDGRYVLTANPSDLNDLYLHDIGERGVFYDNVPTESSITITVNPMATITKIFDNTEFLTDVIDTNGVEVTDETFDSVTSSNSYQTTGIRADIKRTLRNWRHAITYEFGTRNRIRSHWMKQKFSFLNNNNKEFKLYHIINYFRKGDK